MRACFKKYGVHPSVACALTASRVCKLKALAHLQVTSWRLQLTTRMLQGMCRGKMRAKTVSARASSACKTRPAKDGDAHAKTCASRNLARVCTQRRILTMIRLLLRIEVHVPLSALEMKPFHQVHLHLAGTRSHLLCLSTPQTRFVIATSIFTWQ